MSSYAMGRPIIEGSTSITTYVRIVDDKGGPLEGLGTGSLVTWYRRDLATAAHVNIAETLLGTETAPWQSGGWRHIDDGYYRLDVPDAAFVAGAPGVLIGGRRDVGGDEYLLGVYHPLVAYDPLDSVRLGLSALPNADASTPNGLPTVTDVLTQVQAALAAWVIASNNISAAAANKLADHVIRRDFATAAASADGDTKSFRSLLGAIAKLVNKIEISVADDLLIYEADDLTVLGTQAATTVAAPSDVVTALDTV